MTNYRPEIVINTTNAFNAWYRAQMAGRPDAEHLRDEYDRLDREQQEWKRNEDAKYSHVVDVQIMEVV